MPQNSKKTKARSLPKPLLRVKKSIDGFLARRPHRSFRLTKRRDYKRSLKLPGLIPFTRQVGKTTWQYRKILGLLALFFAFFYAALVGIGSQETYTSLTTTLRETSGEVFKGNLGEVGKAGLIFVTIGTSGLNGTLTEGQQIFAVLLILLSWLTTVWLLRNLLAGHVVRLRDGLYNAGTPIVGMFIVALVLVLQILPIALAVIGYSAALTSGLLDGGVAAMLFWMTVALLTTVSLYWITSTFFAMIIVTLPGMYPLKALRTAGDIMVGRRLRILLRILWLAVTVVVAWAIVMILFILLDAWLKTTWTQLEWLPIIPVVILFMTTITVVWTSTYIYLLYRKVVEDGAAPA